MKIDVIGSGSAYSATSNTSSILVSDSSDQKMLIDCGPTIPRALFTRKIDINEVDAIYFTHIHPDHCAGMPALLNNWKSFDRTSPLIIFCQREQKSALQSLTSLANWPDTSLCFDIIWKEITDDFSWSNWEIRTAFTQHAMPNRAISITAEGHKLFYSGDGRPTPESITLMEGADLAFQECACFDALPEDSSHGDFWDCRSLLEKADVKLLGLYHCWDEEIAQVEEHARQVKKMFVSYDGLVINL